MKRIYLLIIVIMFLLFIKGVNSQQLGCCVKTVDKLYCQVTDKDSGECKTNSEWYGGKTNGLDSCSSDFNKCERGCCVLDGVGYPNYYKAQCDDQKSAQDRFIVGNCPDGTDTNHKIGCILGTGECKWWTSEKCSIEEGSVDESVNNENKCNEKTNESEANKRCCKTDCSYKFAYECNGEVGERGVPCGDIPEWCGDKCKWGNDECKNKIAKEIGAEVIKKDDCGGIKHLKYCSTEEYCFNGVCKNANCGDKKHGDKLCIKSNYKPGSRDILRICEFGVVNFVPCDEFRESVCKDNENEMAPGQEFDGANCYENKWGNCFDYKGNNANDCKAKGDCEIIEGQCLPKYPPGVEFWLWNKVKEAFHWNDLMCSKTSEEGCKRSGDCEGGSGVAPEESEGGKTTSTPNDCGYGCCFSGDPSFGIGFGITTTIDKCDTNDYNTEFFGGIICDGTETISVPQCPVSLSGDDYCKCGNTFCKLSGGGKCVVEPSATAGLDCPIEDPYGCCKLHTAYPDRSQESQTSVKKISECNIGFTVISTTPEGWTTDRFTTFVDRRISGYGDNPLTDIIEKVEDKSYGICVNAQSCPSEGQYCLSDTNVLCNKAS